MHHEIVFGGFSFINLGHLANWRIAGSEDGHRLFANIIPVLPGHLRGFTGQAFEQHLFEAFLGLTPFIVADQLADILTNAAIPPVGNLVLDELFHWIGKRDVHGLQDGTSCS